MLCSIVIAVLLILSFCSKDLKGGTTVDKLLGWRGLLCLMIFTDHFSQELSNPGLMWLFSWMGYLIVAVFFSISGYGLTKQLLKKKNDYLSGFLKKRLPSILIPFWLCNIVYLLFNVLVWKARFSALDIVFYISGIKLINTNAWYVISLLALYLIWYVAVRIKGNKPKLCILIILFLTACWGIFCLIVINKFWWMNSTFAFGVGIILAYYQQEIYDILHKWISLIALGVLTVAGVIVSWSLSGYMQIAVMVCVAVITATFFWSVCSRLGCNGYLARFLGKYSYEIYLIHNLFRLLFKEIVVIENDLLYYSCGLICSVILAIIINKISTVCLNLIRSRIS